MRTEAPLLAPIFRSEGQARLLAALLLADDELSLTALAERAGIAYPTAHKEVARLIEAGILRERLAGRTRLISPNPDSPLVKPLTEILTIAAGPAPLLSEAFATIDGVEQAFIFGSFAARAHGIPGDAPRDIDVMVIGTPDVGALYSVSAAVEPQLGRPINLTILAREEWEGDSAFLRHVRENPTIPIRGVAA